MQRSLTALTGWRRNAAAFLAGALSVLALPPVGFFPVLFLTVPAFYWLSLPRENEKKFSIARFLTGWAFGAGYFIFGFYWISYALFVDFERFKWVLPFSLIAGPAAFGLYYGLIPMFASLLSRLLKNPIISFVIAWSVIDYARGHLFTGFPWNLPATAWDHINSILQFVSIGGAYGLSLLTIFWVLLPVYWHEKFLRYAAITSFAAICLWGIFRLETNDNLTAADAPIIRIVQASIPQNMKWDGEAEWRNLEKHVALSKKDIPAAAVIWPETAVTTDLQNFPEVARYIGLNLPKNSIGILGSLRFTINRQNNAPEEYFNSVAVIDNKGQTIATYDKHHLVPFGEYIPFREQLNLTPLALVVSGLGSFTPGSGVATLRVGDLPPFSPLICYEVIFPSRVADLNDRPSWLVNVTNDAWYGHTAGPYQHLATSRMRAIEEGLPLARAANNGISAMIDPLGRVLQSLPLDAVGSFDTPLPASLTPTLYARFGDAMFGSLLIAFALLAFARRR